MTVTNTVRITFTDGQSVQFEHTPPEGSDLGRGTKFEQFTNSNYVSLEVDDQLVMYPMHTIRSIQISPILKPIPPGVVRGITNFKTSE